MRAQSARYGSNVCIRTACISSNSGYWYPYTYLSAGITAVGIEIVSAAWNLYAEATWKQVWHHCGGRHRVGLSLQIKVIPKTTRNGLFILFEHGRHSNQEKAATIWMAFESGSVWSFAFLLQRPNLKAYISCADFLARGNIQPIFMSTLCDYMYNVCHIHLPGRMYVHMQAYTCVIEYSTLWHAPIQPYSNANASYSTG